MMIKNQKELEKEVKLDFFKFDEIKCKCCNVFPSTYQSRQFLLKLDTFRKFLKFPLLLTNCFRCREHNAQIGGAKDSAHLYGVGADCYSNKISFLTILEQAERFNGFSGIGVYLDQRFLHLDCKKRNFKYWLVVNGQSQYFKTFDELVKAITFELIEKNMTGEKL